jgi:hypothetical protein
METVDLCPGRAARWPAAGPAVSIKRSGIPVMKEKQALAGPDFSMKDSEGRVINLEDYRGKKNVVLVFNRGFG